MKLIIGLGNPGKKYENTLHNIGFMVADRLASEHSVSFSELKKTRSLAGKGKMGEEDVILGKPLTFMNNSGGPVACLLGYYRIPASDLIVIHDDMDLEPGRIRISRGGTSAGHKGIESIIGCIGTPDFLRVRVGIGKPPPGRETAAGYVLGNARGDDSEKIRNAVSKASESVESIITEGHAKAMSVHNRREL